MSNKITLELNPSEVEGLVEKLSIEDKIRLVRRLEQETWARKLNLVTQRIRRNIKKTKISAREIDNICEEVKREYDNKYRRH